MASSIQPFLNDARDRMDKCLEHFSTGVRGIRTGRANPGLVENLRVDYYGSPTPMGQLASVTVPEPRCIMVKPFDASTLKDIEKAVMAADLGFNPSIEGKVLRISVPMLSQDQRLKLMGRVKTVAEEAKISMRNVRRDVLKDVENAEKDKDRDLSVTQDDVKSAKSSVQDILKEHEDKLDTLVNDKSSEILDV
ncbi:MAG: ribosome recycling factor [Planctomycetes bacterium]|jgi:ribosome recycling factor|nr:ribosome recycling factor [Planctomycetota bacterium]MBT4028632.1 ribosome recycling factor [Planctomycetota bacterium]MBT4559524.1 ribosome recycling factor [Planctomycetota bacterium]MBT5101632.1 ribosome recycling factor [Planctomycetota bacterium]MBT5119718.1 ribosome recycling factor [Planctomycetota bacterium]